MKKTLLKKIPKYDERGVDCIHRRFADRRARALCVLRYGSKLFKQKNELFPMVS